MENGPLERDQAQKVEARRVAEREKKGSRLRALNLTPD